MSTTVIDNIKLSGTDDGEIKIALVSKPYGDNSEPVASIGISLKANAEQPDWKVHIPKDNIDAVISALQEAKKGL